MEFEIKDVRDRGYQFEVAVEHEDTTVECFKFPKGQGWMELKEVRGESQPRYYWHIKTRLEKRRLSSSEEDVEAECKARKGTKIVV